MKTFPVTLLASAAMLVASLVETARESSVRAQEPPAAGVYSAAQADRGRESYTAYCATCHGDDLAGGGFFDGEPAPALKRPTLLQGWPDLGGFYGFLKRSMPADAPMTLKDDTYADILAHLLRENGYPAGARDLPADPERLKALRPVRGN